MRIVFGLKKSRNFNRTPSYRQSSTFAGRKWSRDALCRSSRSLLNCETGAPQRAWLRSRDQFRQSFTPYRIVSAPAWAAITCNTILVPLVDMVRCGCRISSTVRHPGRIAPSIAEIIEIASATRDNVSPAQIRRRQHVLRRGPFVPVGPRDLTQGCIEFFADILARGFSLGLGPQYRDHGNDTFRRLPVRVGVKADLQERSIHFANRRRRLRPR